MELTIKQALLQGVAAHKEGKPKEAERLYRGILQSQPTHPDANHNLGVLAVGLNQVESSLPHFKVAIEANPNEEQYWLSFIDALIKLGRMDNARKILEQGKANGLKGEKVKALEANIYLDKQDISKKIALIKQYLSQQQFKNAIEVGRRLKLLYPSNADINNILGLAFAAKGNIKKAEQVYLEAIKIEPLFKQAMNNFALLLMNSNRVLESEAFLKKVLLLQPNYSAGLINYGNALHKAGKYMESISQFKKRMFMGRLTASLYNNAGAVYLDAGMIAPANLCFKRALLINPDRVTSYWNLHSVVQNIPYAIKILNQATKIKPNPNKWVMTYEYYRSLCLDKNERLKLLSKFSPTHHYITSFGWLESLDEQPQYFLNRWDFFDAVTKIHKKRGVFYEFGVWFGASFKYLSKLYEFGYGFDSFDGLPDDWHHEKRGSYSSDGNVPKFENGEMIVGTFVDTLPAFFSEPRQEVALIHFDADLYSSTITALKHCRPVIEKNTILIFDNFLMTNKWQEDEFKALVEFCNSNSLSFKVIAVCLFSGQVAVRLSGASLR